MTPAQVFDLANPFAALGWLLLAAGLFAAGAWRTRLLALGGRVWPLALAALYVATLVTHWGSAPGGGFSSLEAVGRLFASPGHLLAGWVHYLAFDLWVGRWIIDDALARDAAPGWGRAALLPVLFGVFMFGPAGLLVYMAWRTLAAKRGR
jgi:hypothetical protein